MERRPKTTAFYRKRLPHWEVDDGSYFVTICVRDAIPSEAAERIWRESEELKKLQGGELLEERRRLFREMEKWLDRREAPTTLICSDLARMLMEAIRHRQDQGVWRLAEFAIMPSHLHLFFQLLEGNLDESLNLFKRWTGRRAGITIPLNGKTFWAREWFDHWSRSAEEDEKIVHYIRQNPVKAGLVADYRQWPYGSWTGEANK